MLLSQYVARSFDQIIDAVAEFGEAGHIYKAKFGRGPWAWRSTYDHFGVNNYCGNLAQVRLCSPITMKTAWLFRKPLKRLF